MEQIEIAKLYLEGLTLDKSKRLIESLSVCGAVLGLWGLNDLSGRKIRAFMSKRARSAAYIEFEVPKKAGGIRRISAPVTSLKHIQQALNLMLQCMCAVSSAAMGFVAGRSIVTNANVHIGSSAIFNCDLKNFFPSITKTMVRDTLTAELRSFNPSREVINHICNLVTAPRADGVEALPQGAPTSPVVSNLVLKQLDRRLSGFAAKNGYRYSRYADDITFSRTGNYSPLVPIKSDAILAIIEDCGFNVNPNKTVLQTQSQRREVTGLTVGEKVNVSRKYIKQFRTLLHLWETRGYTQANCIYKRDFRHDEKIELWKVIRGKINYLRMVKGEDDSTYRCLRYRFRQLVKQEKISKENLPEEDMNCPIGDDIEEEGVDAAAFLKELREKLNK